MSAIYLKNCPSGPKQIEKITGAIKSPNSWVSQVYYAARATFAGVNVLHCFSSQRRKFQGFKQGQLMREGKAEI